MSVGNQIFPIREGKGKARLSRSRAHDRCLSLKAAAEEARTLQGGFWLLSLIGYAAATIEAASVITVGILEDHGSGCTPAFPADELQNQAANSKGKALGLRASRGPREARRSA